MSELKEVDFDNGLTVRELKELLKDWPEDDVYGEPTEVWIETGVNLSSPVRCVTPLNKADLLFESSAYWEVDDES